MSLDARRRANGRRCADVRLVVVVHHGRLPRLVGVIHRRARVKEEYRRRVSPVADAVVDSVVEVPAGFLEVLAARETHQRAVRDGEPAQQRARGDVYCRPPADARDGGRPKLGGKVRMERRSFRGPAPRSWHRRERARRGGAKRRRSARERREGAAHDDRTAASSCVQQRGDCNKLQRRPKMSKLGGLRVVSSRIVNPQTRGNEQLILKSTSRVLGHITCKKNLPC